MKILVLNCGSSSIKYKLYNMDDKSVLAQGGVERIGLDEAFLKLTLPNGEKKVIMHDMPDHKEGVNFVFQMLLDKEIGAISDSRRLTPWVIASCKVATSITIAVSLRPKWKRVLKNFATLPLCTTLAIFVVSEP